MNAFVTIAVCVITMAVGSASISVSAEEKNLVAARNGGQVIKYTSQLNDMWRAENLIDEHTTPGGWSSADGSLPQEIIIRLPGSARFNTLVFNLDSGVPDNQWAREISIYTADPFPTMGGWKLVGQVQLARQPGDQTFTVDSTDGRFIRLVIASTQSSGAERVTLNAFRIFLR
jgi:hypothetical protein